MCHQVAALSQWSDVGIVPDKESQAVHRWLGEGRMVMCHLEGECQE